MDPQALPDPTTFARRRRTGSADQTRALGAALGEVARPGDAILLHGPLGAGKTCLVQGLCDGLGIADEVISPTFTLVNRYPGPVVVDHLDFYRIEPEHDLGDIGVLDILDELDAGRTLLVAEWPNLLVPLLPSRLELLAVPGDAPDDRWWYIRGVPDLPPAWADMFDEAVPPC